MLPPISGLWAWRGGGAVRGLRNPNEQGPFCLFRASPECAHDKPIQTQSLAARAEVVGSELQDSGVFLLSSGSQSSEYKNIQEVLELRICFVSRACSHLVTGQSGLRDVFVYIQYRNDPAAKKLSSGSTSPASNPLTPGRVPGTSEVGPDVFERPREPDSASLGDSQPILLIQTQFRGHESQSELGPYRPCVWSWWRRPAIAFFIGVP